MFNTTWYINDILSNNVIVYQVVISNIYVIIGIGLTDVLYSRS